MRTFEHGLSRRSGLLRGREKLGRVEGHGGGAGVPSLDRDRRLHRLSRAAELLDARWTLPGTRLRFGLDSLVGLIPGVGDLVTTAVSAWIVSEARRLGVRRRTLARMIGNVAIDFAIGSIPILGDLFDFGFHANTRNLRLLERHLEHTRSGR